MVPVDVNRLSDPKAPHTFGWIFSPPWRRERLPKLFPPLWRRSGNEVHWDRETIMFSPPVLLLPPAFVRVFVLSRMTAKRRRHAVPADGRKTVEKRRGPISPEKVRL